MKAALITPRYLLSSITAGVTEDADHPFTNLDDDLPATFARLASRDPAKTWFSGLLTMPGDYFDDPLKTVGGVAGWAHSMQLGAKARVLLLAADAPSYPPEYVLPNTLEEVHNFSGAVTDVDDANPYSLDGNKMTTTALTADARYGFATPSGAPIVGAGKQLFLLALSYTAAPTSLVVSLWANGVHIDSLDFEIAGGAPMPASGSVVQIPWNFFSLSAADIEMRVEVVLASGTFSVEAVGWVCYPDPGADLLADSDWVVASSDVFETSFGGTVRGTSGLTPTKGFDHFPTAEISDVFRWQVEFRDPLNTLGRIDLGELILGPRFSAATDTSYGDAILLRPMDTKKITESGVVGGVARPPLRQVPFSRDQMTSAEGIALFERIWRIGSLGPVYVQPFPGDAVRGPTCGIFGTMESVSALSLVKDYRFMPMSIVFLETR